MEREPLLISACLLGIKCRYDGGDQYRPEAAALLARYELVPVCPELLGGLPVPRRPAEIKGGRVVTAAGADVTAAFRLGAERALELARRRGARLALLKDGSPSCGSTRVHDGEFSGRLVPGKGLAAALLAGNGVEVVSEDGIARLPGLTE